MRYGPIIEAVLWNSLLLKRFHQSKLSLPEIFHLVSIVPSLHREKSQILSSINWKWYDEWDDLRGEDVEPIVWKEFLGDFLDHLFPQESRKPKVEEFYNLKQGMTKVK